MRTLQFGLIAICSLVSQLGATQFTYEKEQLDQLKRRSTCVTMDRKELVKWDKVAEQGLINDRAEDFEPWRLYTYLYVAQAEAAALSHEVKGCYAGTLDPVSNEVMKLFLTNYCRPRNYEADPYSQQIADMVVAKLKERMAKEEANPPAWTCPPGMEKIYTSGLMIAKWIPWRLDDSKAYWPDAPPAKDSPIWAEQINAIKCAQRPMTKSKRQAIRWWAGLAGRGSGDWRTIANQYLFSHRIDLKTTLQVRAELEIGLYDGAIVCFGAKYAYDVQRPDVRDPCIQTYIEVPGHPSCPSGHATFAGVASTILTHFIPCEKCYWEQLATQAKDSRVWAGVHYPIDNEVGFASGQKIAGELLKK